MFEQRNKTTRSPLKARTLRNPGEYLSEEIKRLQTEEIGPYLMGGVMLVFMAAFEWVEFLMKWPPRPGIFTFVAGLMCCWVFIKVSRIRRRVRILRQGEEGEKAVGQFLETLREKGYKVL